MAPGTWARKNVGRYGNVSGQGPWQNGPPVHRVWRGGPAIGGIARGGCGSAGLQPGHPGQLPQLGLKHVPPLLRQLLGRVHGRGRGIRTRGGMARAGSHGGLRGIGGHHGRQTAQCLQRALLHFQRLYGGAQHAQVQVQPLFHGPQLGNALLQLRHAHRGRQGRCALYRAPRLVEAFQRIEHVAGNVEGRQRVRGLCGTARNVLHSGHGVSSCKEPGQVDRANG